MRIFVAGATGVLGRRAVASLIAAGHDVTGIARTPAKAAELRAQGASPVEVSMFEPDALRAADIDRLSPLEALNLLAELKRKADE